eukprot:730424-Pleurochrysis_carterae.AAC.1
MSIWTLDGSGAGGGKYNAACGGGELSGISKVTLSSNANAPPSAIRIPPAKSIQRPGLSSPSPNESRTMKV